MAGWGANNRVYFFCLQVDGPITGGGGGYKKGAHEWGGLETLIEKAVYYSLKNFFANFSFFLTGLFLSKDQNTNIAPT